MAPQIASRDHGPPEVSVLPGCVVASVAASQACRNSQLDMSPRIRQLAGTSPSGRSRQARRWPSARASKRDTCI